MPLLSPFLLNELAQAGTPVKSIPVPGSKNHQAVADRLKRAGPFAEFS